MSAKSRLRERLTDPGRSGVYRVSRDTEVRDSLSAGDADLVEIEWGGGKEALLASFAGALGFPDWFGGNWDALEDSLTDLSWREDAPRILLINGAAPGDDLGILADVLSSAAEFWRERGRVFFAIFVDPEGELDFPPLFREKPVR